MRKSLLTILSIAFVCSLPLTGCSNKPSNASGGIVSKTESSPKSLAVESMPSKTTYVEGQKFSKTGMKISCLYEDGTKETLKNSDVTISPNRALTLSDTKVTATYKKLSVDIPISVVKKALESIIVDAPSITVAQKDVYGFEGLTVYAHYNDGSEDVELTSEEYKLSINGEEVRADGICDLNPGTYKVLVTSQKKTAEFEITVVVKTVKDVKFTCESDLTFAKGGTFDFSVIHAVASYEEDLADEEVSLSRPLFVIDGNPIESGDSITLSKGTYTLAVSLRMNEAFSETFILTIFEGYKIEAENITDKEDSEMEASSTSFVKGKTSADATSYVSYHERTGSPLASLHDSKTASGGGYLGEIKGKSYIEFHFKSDIRQKATVSISAASSWLRKDNNWDPLWMGDLQLNKVFSSTANGNSIPIADDVILPGSGSEENTASGVATWFTWKDVDFGTMDLVEGWNVITMEIKPGEELGEYVNSHGGYTMMNLDFVQVSFENK